VCSIEQSVEISTNKQTKMILQDTINEVEQIGNITEQSEFSIKASRKAFSILSGLYSDIHLGIIREIGANAMDAHVAAGKKDIPIEIHLPNALEPWLTIKDQGTGISHKDIYSIYTTYFESTKTNTNEQTGCFGIGGKIFFAYTDNSTIYSIVDGVKRTYNAFINAGGLPSISLVSQNNTNEPNGFAVQIPIKSNDFEKFKDATFRACRYYEVKPTITGGKIDWNIDKPDFVGSFWRSYTKLNQSYALMGNVAYPINTYQLSYDNQELARKAGLVINFNLGDLEITPSREDLTYSDLTLKTLNEKIESVKADFVSNVENTIKNSPNLLDALKALYLLKNQWSFLNSSMLNNKVYWNSIDITDPRTSIKAIATSLVSYSKNRWGRKKIKETGYADLSENALWYYDNLPRGSVKRVTHYVRHSGNGDISINFVSESEMKGLISAGFPSSIFLPTSSLPQITVNRASGGGRNSKPKGTINIYSIGYYYKSSWDAESFDLSSGTPPKYYIVKGKDKGWTFNLGTIRDNNGKAIVTPTSKEKLRDVLAYLKISENDVRMVAESNAKHLKALGSKDLSDVVGSTIINIDKDKMAIAKTLNHHTIYDICKNGRFKKIDSNNEFKKFILSQRDIINEVKKHEIFLKYFVVDEKKSLTFPSSNVKLQYLACESWQVGIEIVLDAILENEQSN
jgi:hypothetical protein